MTFAIDWLQGLLGSFPSGPEFYDFYAKNLRGSLFSGFLTLGGFLFSVNTFIVVNMKKELYDQQSYQDRINSQRPFNQKLTVYGPLRRLSRLLLVAVVASVAAAVSQLSIGLVQRWWAAAVCIVLSAVAVVLLSMTLWVIRNNLVALFEFLDDEERKKADAAKKAADEASDRASDVRPKKTGDP